MQQSNAYTFGFAIVVCVIASLMLSIAATSLRDRQQDNIIADKQKNILKAAAILSADKVAAMSKAMVKEVFSKSVETLVVSSSKGSVVDGVDPESLDPEDDVSNLVVYRIKSSTGAAGGYVIPIQGKGLWSTLYGYFALNADGETVRGITFYKHGETPGLGAEIEQDWFQKNFIGKKIVDDKGLLVSIKIAKGKASALPQRVQSSAVDGISGATLTCRGVESFLKRVLTLYEPFFKRIRQS